MNPQMTKTRRLQLDRFFQDNSMLSKLSIRSGNWITQIREALGMSKSDLAERLGVIPARVVRIEKDEAAGKLTIETMNKVAEALNCEFVYAFVPKGASLQSTVENQAEKVAQSLVREVDQTMALEEQRTSSSARRDLTQSLAQDLVAKNDRRIWKVK